MDGAYDTDDAYDTEDVYVYLGIILAAIMVVFINAAGSGECNRDDEVAESPQFRTVAPSRLGDDAPAMAHLTPSHVPSPSAPIELSTSNANANATETRSERIRNRLVFQQVLSLPSYKKREKRKKKKKSKKAKPKKKKSKKSKTKRNDAQDGFEGIHQQSSSDKIEEVSPSALDTTSANEDMTRKGSKKRSTKNKTFVQDIEMGNENNEDENESCRIHRGNNGKFASTLRSIRRSIQLFVFYNHDSKGIDEEDILESKKAMKDQLTCSICLEEYVVGDVVVRLKENNSGDNTRDDSGAHSCKHCFHEDCILDWLRTHDECPLCRFNMLTDTS